MKKLPAKVGTIGWTLLIIGVVLISAAFFADMKRAYFNYIIMYSFIVSIGVGSLGFAALEYIVDATWSTPFRRINEFLASAIPVLLVLAIPIILGIHNIFEWSDPEVVNADAILKAKAPYLNVPFFIIRTFGFVLIWILFFILITKNSQKQDSLTDVEEIQKLHRRNIKISILFAPLLMFTLTFSAFDLMMSLEPHWYSTIYGVYYFAGTAVSSLAAMVLISVLLFERGYLAEGLTKTQFHSMGTLLFGMNIFWAYIAFSQFLLMWYADIPEETVWYQHRMHGSWGYVSLILLFFHFVIPFLIMLPGIAKTNLTTLKAMAVWLLFAHYFDLYWLVFPTLSKSEAIFSWNEFGFIFFIAGLFIVIFKMKMDKVNITPINDIKLEHGIEMHLHPDLSID